MEKSENINELAAALSKFQGEVPDLIKHEEVRIGNSKYCYADLHQVLEIARPLLCKHGLAISQLCGNTIGEVVLETVLAHSSGQWIMSKMILPFEPSKFTKAAQSAGGSISYARRYSISAMLGLAQKDNDLSDEQPVHKPYRQPTAVPKPVPIDSLPELMGLIDKHEIDSETVDKWKDHYKVGSLGKLSQQEMRSIIHGIKKRKGDGK